LAFFGPQQLPGGLDLHTLGDVADLHRNVHADRAGDVHFDILASGFLEAGLLHVHPIRSGNEVEELIDAALAGLRLTPLAGIGVGNRNLRADNSASGSIHDRSNDRTEDVLPEQPDV